MNRNTRQEISTLMRDAAVSFSEANGELHPVYTCEADYAITVLAIDTLTDKIIRSNEKLFALKMNAFSKQKYIAPTKTGRWLLSTLQTDVPGIRACFSNHEFSPRFELLVKHARARGLDHWLSIINAISAEEVTKACDILDGLVSALREEGRRTSFKAQLHRFQRSAGKNNLSLYRYLRKTLIRQTKINVRRYDLSYQKEGVSPMLKAYSMTYQEAKEHREALIKAVRKNLIGRHLIGYAWKMEHSAERGFLHHLLLVLEEASLEEQVLVDAALKEAWNEVTKTKGLLIDCSALYPSCKSIGIGPIDSNDNEALATFRKICLYMTQIDNCIKLSLPGSAKAFGKAELTAKKAEA